MIDDSCTNSTWQEAWAQDQNSCASLRETQSYVQFVLPSSSLPCVDSWTKTRAAVAAALRHSVGHEKDISLVMQCQGNQKRGIYFTERESPVLASSRCLSISFLNSVARGGEQKEKHRQRFFFSPIGRRHYRNHAHVLGRRIALRRKGREKKASRMRRQLCVGVDARRDEAGRLRSHVVCGCSLRKAGVHPRKKTDMPSALTLLLMVAMMPSFASAPLAF
jgi:hypothetical protein